MVRLRILNLGLATLALMGARSASAAAVKLTGVVENDFLATNSNVRVTPVSDSPITVGPAQFMINNGWVSGWAVKDIRSSYDAATDTLSVGINTFKDATGKTAIVGDADGNGDPGGASPPMAAAGGIDTAHLGGHKSVAIAFASDSPGAKNVPGNAIIVAGVPADKSAAGPGIDGFTVALPKAANLGLAYNFGKSLTDASGHPIGRLAFDPSADHPGFEFTIKGFSKIPGLDPFKGFWIKAYAGSPEDVVVGETGLAFTRVPAFSEQQIPEPATVLAWSLVVGGGVVVQVRRRAGAGR